MKQINKLCGVGLVLIASVLAGCNTENTPAAPQGAGTPVAVAITASGSKITRTGYENSNGIHRTVWVQETDEIGVFGYDVRSGSGSIGANAKFTIGSIAATGAATFQGTLTDPASGAAFSAKYYSYYPWQSGVGADPAALNWTLAATQYPTAATFDGAADLLLGQPVAAEAPIGQMMLAGEAVPVNFIFLRPVAITAFSFASLPAKINNDPVQSVTVKIAGAQIAGDALVNITQETPEFAMSGSTVDEITLDYTDKSVNLTNDFKAWIMMAPANAASFELTIETEKYTIQRTVNAPSEPFDFKAGMLNTLAISLEEPLAVITAKSEETSAPVADWIDVMMTDQGAVNMASATLSVTTGSGTQPPTAYDNSIRFWTGAYDGGTGTGTNGRGTSYYKLLYSTNDDFKTAITTSFTIEVYCKTLDALDRSSFSSMNTNGLGFRRDGAGGLLRGHAYIGGGWKYMTFPANNTTDYYHYLFTYDGAEIASYLNGVQTSTIACTGVLKVASGPTAQEFVVGGDAMANGSNGLCQMPFNGDIAFARIHGKALSAAEVSVLYQQVTLRNAVNKFDDLNTALTVTLAAMTDGEAKTNLLTEGWALMNNISTTEAQITNFLGKLE